LKWLEQERRRKWKELLDSEIGEESKKGKRTGEIGMEERKREKGMGEKVRQNEKVKRIDLSEEIRKVGEEKKNGN